MANVTIEVNFGKTTLDAIRSLTMKSTTAKNTKAADDAEEVEEQEMTSIENDDDGAPRTRKSGSKRAEETEEEETEEYDMADSDDDSDDAEEVEEEEEPAPAKAAAPRTPKLEDCQKALIAYRKRHGNNDAGHTKAINVMKKITGEKTLSKVDPKKYGKLIAALS